MGIKKVTQDMISDFIKLYTIDKLCINKIGEKYNVNGTTVRKYLLKNNIPLRNISEAKTKITDDMISDFITLYNKGTPVSEIGKKYNIGSTTVYRYLNNNDVVLNATIENKYNKQLKSEQYKDDVIRLYQNGLSQDKIEKEIGICRKTIRDILRQNNIHIRDNTEYRKYYLNQDYFEIIDTQNKAYTLGFLYADGNVSKEKYNIQLSLQEGDKHILESISKDMETNTPLVYRNLKKYNNNQQNQYSISLHSKKMHQDLCKLGVVPNKTHGIEYPNFLPEDLHRHFIRGMMDGDGCIHPPYGNYNKIKTVDICGTYKFCMGLKQIIEEKLNIHCSVIKTSPDVKRTTYKTTVSGGIQVSKFLDWIYSDANLYLYRKYDIYQKYYNKNIA